MKKALLIFVAILILGAGGVWAYLQYAAHSYARNITCANIMAGVQDLLTDANVQNDNLRSAYVAFASSTVLGYANIRMAANNPVSAMSTNPVPFTAYNQLASMCAAKPDFKIWTFVRTNEALAKTDAAAANEALDAELAGVTVQQFNAGQVFAKILSAFRMADAEVNGTPVSPNYQQNKPVTE